MPVCETCGNDYDKAFQVMHAAAARTPSTASNARSRPSRRPAPLRHPDHRPRPRGGRRLSTAAPTAPRAAAPRRSATAPERGWRTCEQPCVHRPSGASIRRAWTAAPFSPPSPRSALAALPAAQPVNVRRSTATSPACAAPRAASRQTNPDRSTQTGTFYLQKPGRIRFEYDKPKGAMVIADGAWVGVFDPKSNRNPTRYPLDKTPLSLLLRDRLSLTEPGLVLGATRDARRHRHHRGRSPGAEGGPHGDELRRRPGRSSASGSITTKTGQRTRVALSDLDDRHRPRPQPLQHRARRRPLPLTLNARCPRRPPGRPVLRRVEIDHRPPPRRRHLGDERCRLAHHLPRAAVAGKPRQRLEEPPPEEHRMPRRPVRAHRPADLAPRPGIEGRDQPVDVAAPSPPACPRAGSPPRPPRAAPPRARRRIEAAIPSAQSAASTTATPSPASAARRAAAAGGSTTTTASARLAFAASATARSAGRPPTGSMSLSRPRIRRLAPAPARSPPPRPPAAPLRRRHLSAGSPAAAAAR